MKKYNVTVNGTAYEVTVEAVNAADIKAPAVPATPAPAAAPAPAAVPAAAPAGGEKISSPMPGTILSVNVSNGSAVKKGDVLMILEAMKMENEIVAPEDGTVASINVSSGDSVEAGTVLATLN